LTTFSISTFFLSACFLAFAYDYQHPISTAEIEKWETDTTANAPDTDPSDAKDFVNNSTSPTTLPSQYRSLHQNNRRRLVLAGIPLHANNHRRNQVCTKQSNHNAHPSTKPTLPAAIFQSRTSLRRFRAAHAASSVALRLLTMMNQPSSALLCWMSFSHCSAVSTTTTTTMESGE
jgi:hypothetical protein